MQKKTPKNKYVLEKILTEYNWKPKPDVFTEINKKRKRFQMSE